ncbi:SGNH/GDSL hydrolase family protein [Flavilitoribacter nigricans]|uniref:G-D-S-L family lipolytic protein n=1 Tax=Flavilitoribacter nigricans (strain ATCC 23147 / DSM 23189 / NBRC 102662 / NCIMB 1420 / SS-2) TaxID=1122177 RepID=A0A2D0NJF4_FLAN2|nr:GDSL-type esterase/lipase family protein [Flavilitoribacter nigricans]PHN07863.1 G-D-S-L family lipolytic protein [Flavilitoribacter nigricans DSM 23189 = NBRC 102662]
MKITSTFAILLLGLPLIAQPDPAWDDTRSVNWPQECRQVEIPSTADQQPQAAYFFRATGDASRPLIVSLHTWSGGYDQKDTLSWMSVKNNYNYIHPDFRGPNNRPEACGSELAIQDIEDAISYAIREARVDTSEIHVIGVSGGGYSTLLTYMRTHHPVKTFSAWVPISNLVDWYYESVGRKQKYAREIALATHPDGVGEDGYSLDSLEARKRSPIFMDTPVERREHSKLYIHAGIHDGYQGSVPITQSLRFFNKVVSDHDPAADTIGTDEMLQLLERRNGPLEHPGDATRGLTHFQRQYRDKVRMTIFEGGHELLADRVLAPLNGKRVLAIGDSNGALEEGWVNQLRELRFADHVYNTCVSGNTIGFDNLGRESLNTLANADRYLEEADRGLGGLDKIVILLGTNDCKAVFDDRLAEVPENLRKLLRQIKAHPVYQRDQPEIYVVSPPPYAPDEALIPKYHGGAADIAWLFPRFREVAEEESCTFIDIYSGLAPEWETWSEDGIHLIEAGQVKIAEMIAKKFEN